MRSDYPFTDCSLARALESPQFFPTSKQLKRLKIDNPKRNRKEFPIIFQGILMKNFGGKDLGSVGFVGDVLGLPGNNSRK